MRTSCPGGAWGEPFRANWDAQLLAAIPGVSMFIALAITCRIGPISRFPCGRNAADLLGLTPGIPRGSASRRIGGRSPRNRPMPGTGAAKVRWKSSEHARRTAGKFANAIRYVASTDFEPPAGPQRPPVAPQRHAEDGCAQEYGPPVAHRFPCRSWPGNRPQRSPTATSLRRP
jgi:hypothetical protein